MPRPYHWSIARTHIKQHKASTFRLIVAIAFCTFLAGATIGLHNLFSDRMQKLEESVRISLFLKPEIDEKSATDLAADLSRDANLATIEVQSPDSLRTYFEEHYGVNVAEVLPANPFPFVLKIAFKPGMLNADSFVALVQQFRSMNTVVDEVSYPSEYVRAVLNESRIVWWSLIIGSSLIALICLAILWYALRSESVYLPDDVRIIQLMGAKKSFLARSALWRSTYGAIIGMTIGSALSWTVDHIAVGGAWVEVSVVSPQVLLIACGLILLMILILHRRSLPTT